MTDLIEAETSPLPPRFGIVFAGLLTTVLLSSLDQTIVATALPTIVGELSGLSQMAWVTTAYILAATIAMPIYGRMGDLLGRKGLFLGAIGIFIVGSVVAGAAQTMVMLIIGRGIQGLGGGGLIVLSQAIIADLVPARQRARYMTPIGGIFGLATVLGPVLGGWFTDHHAWRWAFWINIPLGVVAIAICAYALRLPRKATRASVDYPGIALMVGAVTCTVLVASWGGTRYGWSDPIILGLSAAAVLAWAGFFFVETHVAEPLIPVRMLRNRTYVVATLVSMAIVGIGMFVVVAYIPTYLQMVYGTGATVSGLYLLPMVLGILATTVPSGLAISRTGRYKIWPVAGAATVTLTAFLISTLRVETPMVVVGVYLFVMGAGIGMLMQTLVLAVQNAFPPSEVGIATASNNFFREIGATLGTAVIGTVFTHRLTARLPESSAALGGHRESLTPAVVHALPLAVRDEVVVAYQQSLAPVFAYLIPVFAVGLVLALVLPDTKLASTQPAMV